MASRRERIPPPGSTVAGVVLGPPILQTPAGGEPFVADTGFLIGPHDRPLTNEPTDRTDVVGVVTTPIGCGPSFGLAPTAIRGGVADLPTAWPAGRGLRAELLGTSDSADLLD